LENPVVFIFHSLNIWLMYYLMTYFCFFAFEPTMHLTPLAALTVYVFGTFGMVIPSPGGMGTYHFLATSALLLYGVKGDDAFSFANIMFFSIQIFYTIIVGVVSIFLIRYLNKKTKTISLEPALEMESELK
jgi:glycosyltransferase 2 family protein